MNGPKYKRVKHIKLEWTSTIIIRESRKVMITICFWMGFQSGTSPIIIFDGRVSGKNCQRRFYFIDAVLHGHWKNRKLHTTKHSYWWRWRVVENQKQFSYYFVRVYESKAYELNYMQCLDKWCTYYWHFFQSALSKWQWIIVLALIYIAVLLALAGLKNICQVSVKRVNLISTLKHLLEHTEHLLP